MAYNRRVCVLKIERRLFLTSVCGRHKKHLSLNFNSLWEFPMIAATCGSITIADGARTSLYATPLCAKDLKIFFRNSTVIFVGRVDFRSSKIFLIFVDFRQVVLQFSFFRGFRFMITLDGDIFNRVTSNRSTFVFFTSSDSG